MATKEGALTGGERLQGAGGGDGVGAAGAAGDGGRGGEGASYGGRSVTRVGGRPFLLRCPVAAVVGVAHGRGLR